MRGQWTRWLVAMVASLGAVIGLALWADWPESTAGIAATTDDATARGEASADELRWRAMITIRYYAYRARNLIPADVDPQKLGLMDLDKATNFLIRDSVESLAGRSRRRRAIALLAGYSKPSESETIERWRALVASQSATETISEALSSPQEALASPSAREQTVYELLETVPVGRTSSTEESLQLPIPGCGPTSMKSDEPDIKAATATTGVLITVTKDADYVRKRLDPQEWDQRNRYFWPPERTYLVPKPQPTTIVPCADFATVPAPAPAPSVSPGATFSLRHLYEHAGCGSCKEVFAFKNILTVQARPGSDACEKLPDGWCTCPGCTFAYQTCYGLESPLSACVSGETPVLKIDEGHLSACQTAPNETTVMTKKKIQFDQLSASVSAFYGFYLGQSEILASVAEQLCCQQPGC